MNEAVGLAAETVTSAGLGDLLALLGLPSGRKVGVEFVNPAEEILKGITSHVDELLTRAISAQTKDEFVATRGDVFGQYAFAVTSLARFVRNIVPESVIERALGDSFCEMEAEFRDHGVTQFGEPAKDQAMFTVWTFRRTSRLLSKIVNSPISDELKPQDIELAVHFSFFAAWTQFHLDCMLAAMRFNKPIQLTVLPEIINGLRGAVNAYGYARQGLNLRNPAPEPEIRVVWDEEDQALLNSSMHEMERELIEWAPPLISSPTTALIVEVPASEIVVEDHHEPSPIFGTHIREGIEIIKDWVASRKS